MDSGQEDVILMAPSRMIASSRLTKYRKLEAACTNLRKGFFLLLCPVLEAWGKSFYGFSFYKPRWRSTKWDYHHSLTSVKASCEPSDLQRSQHGF